MKLLTGKIYVILPAIALIVLLGIGYLRYQSWALHQYSDEINILLGVKQEQLARLIRRLNSLKADSIFVSLGTIRSINNQNLDPRDYDYIKNQDTPGTKPYLLESIVHEIYKIGVENVSMIKEKGVSFSYESYRDQTYDLLYCENPQLQDCLDVNYATVALTIPLRRNWWYVNGTFRKFSY